MKSPRCAKLIVGLLSVAVGETCTRAEEPYRINWVRQVGSAGDDIGSGVSVDGMANVYLSGHTTGSLAATNSASLQTPFLARLNSDGDLYWTRQQDSIPGLGNAGTRVAPDGVGGAQQVVNVAPKYQGFSSSLWHYDSTGAIVSTTYMVSDAEEFFGISTDAQGQVYMPSYANGLNLRKYSPQGGTSVWYRRLETGSGTGSFGVSAEFPGSVYVSGYTGDSLIAPSAGNADGFIARYTDAGNFLWARQFGSAGTDFVWDVAADVLGNVYTVGQTSGSLAATNAGGDFDVFITKHDAAGELQWMRQLGSAATSSSQIPITEARIHCTRRTR